ncbi:elongation factor P 5-aminopentanone reductase [Aquibacillus salsiterrae]|uniref:SDR family oxidoreductase n=1 Tax=Aquibacillus salsiterrae TaxID=2950439 RepID=A0A9X4AFL6_9BACI|nr:SDR family oxidoreductase [Aquibacillus salsiterrae]MDC3416335.1 SDR family oxidoreductase [Aquibacillus salsiterrae]
MGGKCLVVGASGDIGLAIVKKLAVEGHRIILHYNRDKQVFNELVAESIDSIVQGDLSTSQGIHQFLEHLDDSIENVVFASGISHVGLFQDTTEQIMDRMIHLHVKAPWMISKYLLPNMITNKKGNIILISSIWGTKGASCEVVYSSVKGAQNTFVKALAKEVGPSGIRVNAVSPGFIDTKMNQVFSAIEKRELIEEIPLLRSGQPVDVANLVAFLLSAESAYIHGEVIEITGGWD